MNEIIKEHVSPGVNEKVYLDNTILFDELFVSLGKESYRVGISKNQVPGDGPFIRCPYRKGKKFYIIYKTSLADDPCPSPHIINCTPGRVAFIKLREEELTKRAETSACLLHDGLYAAEYEASRFLQKVKAYATAKSSGAMCRYLSPERAALERSRLDLVKALGAMAKIRRMDW